MNYLQSVSLRLESWMVGLPLGELLGLTLLHYMWQGALIAVVTAVVLTVLRMRPAQERYAVSLLGMVAMMVMPLVTLLFLAQSSTVGSGTAVWPASLAWMVASVSNPAPPHLLNTLAAFWAAGFAVLQFRLLGSWYLLMHLGGVGALAAEPWVRMSREIAGQMGITRPVRLLETSRVRVPSTAGWLRPVIFLPLEIARVLTPTEMRAIIAHELAHIRRFDYLVNIVQGVFESALFFHPATWWLSFRVRDEREYCCDDIAVQHCTSRLEYARALSSLEELRHGGANLALASTGGSLMKRIGRLFDTPATEAHPARFLAPIVSLAGLAVVLALVGVGCGDAEKTIVSSESAVSDGANSQAIDDSGEGTWVYEDGAENEVVVSEDLDSDAGWYEIRTLEGEPGVAGELHLLREDPSGNKVAFDIKDTDATFGQEFEGATKEERLAMIKRKIQEDGSTIHTGESGNVLLERIAHPRVERKSQQPQLDRKLFDREEMREEIEARIASGKIRPEDAERAREKLRRVIELHDQDSDPNADQ